MRKLAIAMVQKGIGKRHWDLPPKQAGVEKSLAISINPL
jgi:hypothetical protein